jgi:SAM-dependent methyltransferase
MMLVNNKSEKTENILANRIFMPQWQSDYLDADMDRFYDLAFTDILKMINAGPTDRMFDAGCGSCYHTVRLARSGALITAVDFSDVAPAVGESTIAKAGIADQVQLDRANLTASPLAAAWLIIPGYNQWGLSTGDSYAAKYKSWDTVVALNHHLPQ